MIQSVPDLIKDILDQGYTGKQLARLLDVSEPTITTWKLNKRKRFDVKTYNQLLKIQSIGKKK